MSLFGERSIVSMDGLREFAREIWAVAAARKRVAVLLSGPMGVGKTELARAVVAAASGGEDTADDPSSPTFAIHNRYQAGANVIDHFDLYRVENAEDLESTGFWDILSEPGDRLALIEWPERLDWEDLPSSWAAWQVALEFSDEVSGDRRVVVEKLRG